MVTFTNPLNVDQVALWMSERQKEADKKGLRYATAIRELDARIEKGEKVIQRKIEAGATIDELTTTRDKLQGLKDERAKLLREWSIPAFVMSVLYHLGESAKRLDWPIAKDGGSVAVSLPGIIEVTLSIASPAPF